MTLNEFIASIKFLGFTPKHSQLRYETKEFIIYFDDIYKPNTIITKKYLQQRNNKQFNKLDKALNYITKSYQLDKPIIEKYYGK